MKALVLFLMVVSGLTVQAANFGKFKLTVNTGYFDPEVVTFLMNSSGEVKELENDYYYTIESLYFFGETTLKILSGGDDDIVKGIVSLKNNKAVDACGVMLSLSNYSGELLGENSFKLERWNKFSKKYESVYPEGQGFSSECEEKLLSGYEDFDIF